MVSLQPVWEVAVGAVVLVVSMVIHGAGMYLVLLRAAHHDGRFYAAELAPGRQLFFGALIIMMLGTHIVEMLVWTAVLTGLGAIENLRDSFYFATVTYTTLGYQDIKLPRQWRLLAPLCAMTGVVAFGWTTSVMVRIMGRDFAPPGTLGAPPSAVRPGGQGA